MKRLLLLALLLLAASCGGGGKVAPTLSSLNGGFNLADISVIGSGRLVATVAGDVAAPEVIISVEGAKELKGAIFTLTYPNSSYHPVAVDFGGFLGAKDEVISLSVTDRAGEVPVGIVKIHPDEVTGANGDGIIARVSFASGGLASKSVSAPPVGNHNKPKNLTIIETGTPGTFQLMWNEMHVGDYDNNGIVNISDITPIAMHYGQAAGLHPAVELITGGEGVVGVANITGIAQNFGTSLEGYNVYVAGDPSPRPHNTNPAAPYSVMRPVPPPEGRILYTFLVDLAGPAEVRVRPCDTDGNEGVESDPAIPGSGSAPAAPRNLGAVANETVGVGRILLSWSANTEPDLFQYRIFRRDGAVGVFNQIGVVAAGAVPLTFSDNNSGLMLSSGIPYTYHIKAVNTASQVSAASNEATASPFYPGPPTAPTSIAVKGEGNPYSFAIEVKWGPATSSYLDGYEIWRKAPGDTDFSLLQTAGAVGDRTIYDTGLTGGETYTYKVRAFDQFDQFSPFTAEASAQPSTHIPLAIISVTTNNTTMTIGSTTEKANLVVTLNNPAANVTWTASRGTFDNATSKTPIYSPPATGTAAKVVITVTANDGIDNVQGTVDAILTTLPILGPPIDFTFKSWSTPNTPYAPFSSFYDDGKAILLNWGAYW